MFTTILLGKKLSSGKNPSSGKYFLFSSLQAIARLQDKLKKEASRLTIIRSFLKLLKTYLGI
jgi:hypothetical protein